MPLYDYRCKNCGTETEVNQAFSDAPLTVCTVCGGPLRRVISKSTGVIFRGSGFYVTDNRGTNPAGPKTATATKESDGAAASTPNSAPASTPASTPAKPEAPTARAAAD